MKARYSPRLRPLALMTLLAAGGVQAFEIDTGNPDLKLRWDNTVRYSAAFRLNNRSTGLSQTGFGPGGIVGPNNINQDDGDNNFGQGNVSNRFDLLSELDITGKDFGARFSGAAWYDTVYNSDTQNHSTTGNHTPSSAFTDETRDLMGRKSELLDAFVYGRFELGGKSSTVRLGRHTLLWGESLFFGANGIAGGQAPLDLIKLLSVPNSTFKEISRPTGKLSAQVQLTDAVSVGGYVGYEWEKTRLMPVGAYLSTSDSMGPGAENINAGATGVFQRQPDVEASNTGQGGLQLRWRVDSIDTDLGFYAIRYHATTPSNLTTTLTGFPPGLTASSYRWYYHEGIEAYGASFAKTVGEWGWAGEASYRTNNPLSSSGQSVLPSIGVGTTYNNTSNAPYAIGDTAHAQVSWIASLGPNFIARESSFVGEVAWNTVVNTTKNEKMRNPNSDTSATAMRVVYTPTYRQALPGWDVSPSVGLGYAWGRSAAVGPGFGVDQGGDLNIGLGAVYLGKWFVNLNYVQYLGKEGPTLDNASNVQFLQSLKDRDFLTLSVRTTF